MRVQRNLQTAALNVRHSVAFIVLKKKGRQGRRRKSQITRRQSKIKNFLTSYKQSRPHNRWKKFRQPYPTRKNKLIRGNLLAAFRLECAQFAFRAQRFH